MGREKNKEEQTMTSCVYLPVIIAIAVYLVNQLASSIYRKKGCSWIRAQGTVLNKGVDEKGKTFLLIGFSESGKTHFARMSKNMYTKYLVPGCRLFMLFRKTSAPEGTVSYKAKLPGINDFLKRKRAIVIILVAVFLSTIMAISCSADSKTKAGSYSSVLTKKEKAVVKKLEKKYGKIYKTETEKKNWIAHRGFSTGAPENTAPAFELAGRFNAYGIEGDVVSSADGVLFMAHPDSGRIEEMTGSDIKVREATWRELRSLRITGGNNVGLFKNLHLCTFTDYLKICRKYDAYAFVDIKKIAAEQEAAVVNKIMQTIRKYKMQKKCVILSRYFSILRTYFIMDKGRTPLVYYEGRVEKKEKDVSIILKSWKKSKIKEKTCSDHPISKKKKKKKQKTEE